MYIGIFNVMKMTYLDFVFILLNSRSLIIAMALIAISIINFHAFFKLS